MTSNQDFKQDVSGTAADGTTVSLQDHEHPSTAIAEAVADVTGQPQTELEPLQRSVDADALDNLFVESNERLVEVSFEYAGTNVRVTDDVVEVWR